MFKKVFLPASVATLFLSSFIILSLSNCTANTPSRGAQMHRTNKTTVAQRGELVVAMDVEMPGFFTLGDENYGYQYDLMKAFAKHMGAELRVVSGKSPANCSKMILEGEVDMIATVSGNLSQQDVAHSVNINNTHFLLLGSKSRAKEAKKIEDFSLIEFIEGGRILITSSFQATDAYQTLLDSVKGSQIYVSSDSSIEIVEQLNEGDFDFAICETGETHIAMALSKNVGQIYSFAETITLCTVVSPKEEGLKVEFEGWLERFRTGEEYAMLNYLYFETGIVRQFTDKEYAASGRGISPYDKLIKEICRGEGYDWRFISAIAYNESRFQANVVSRGGARGLMQVMPSTARQFRVNGDIMEPANNVLLGVKILGKIENSLKFEASTPKNERLKIVLACYNAGIGHVMDARNLAKKYGANPDLWSDVSQYLRLKSDPMYANDGVVKNGKFNGRETLAFVDKVIHRYDIYCKKTPL